jgi:hypothetical protein
MSREVDLPWGDYVVRLEPYEIERTTGTHAKVADERREYVKAHFLAPTGITGLGYAPWQEFRTQLLHWLQGEPVDRVCPGDEWAVLVPFVPLQYSFYGSVKRPPWRLHLQDARGPGPVKVLLEREVAAPEVEVWIARL